MAIYSGFSHEKWCFSIAMLVHQRVWYRVMRMQQLQLTQISLAGLADLPGPMKRKKARLYQWQRINMNNEGWILPSNKKPRDFKNWTYHGLININGYGSIPTNTIFRGMNIHLPATVTPTRGTRPRHTAKWTLLQCEMSRVLQSAVGAAAVLKAVARP